jgi:hypothetical protein
MCGALLILYVFFIFGELDLVSVFMVTMPLVYLVRDFVQLHIYEFFGDYKSLIIGYLRVIGENSLVPAAAFNY